MLIADKGGIEITSDPVPSGGKVQVTVECLRELFVVKFHIVNKGTNCIHFTFYTALHRIRCFTLEDERRVTRACPLFLCPGEMSFVSWTSQKTYWRGQVVLTVPPASSLSVCRGKLWSHGSVHTESLWIFPCHNVLWVLPRSSWICALLHCEGDGGCCQNPTGCGAGARGSLQTISVGHIQASWNSDSGGSASWEVSPKKWIVKKKIYRWI